MHLLSTTYSNPLSVLPSPGVEDYDIGVDPYTGRPIRISTLSNVEALGGGNRNANGGTVEQQHRHHHHQQQQSSSSSSAAGGGGVGVVAPPTNALSSATSQLTRSLGFSPPVSRRLLGPPPPHTAASTNDYYIGGGSSSSSASSASASAAAASPAALAASAAEAQSAAQSKALRSSILSVLPPSNVGRQATCREFQDYLEVYKPSEKGLHFDANPLEHVARLLGFHVPTVTDSVTGVPEGFDANTALLLRDVCQGGDDAYDIPNLRPTLRSWTTADEDKEQATTTNGGRHTPETTTKTMRTIAEANANFGDTVGANPAAAAAARGRLSSGGGASRSGGRPPPPLSQ